MYLADRLRQFREVLKLSQGDIEKRTGLLRCYISRVENGHTTPALETLEKIARAYGVPLYQLFYDGENGVAEAAIAEGDGDWASHGRGQRLFYKLARALARMNAKDRELVMQFARNVSQRKRTRA